MAINSNACLVTFVLMMTGAFSRNVGEVISRAQVGNRHPSLSQLEQQVKKQAGPTMAETFICVEAIQFTKVSGLLLCTRN